MEEVKLGALGMDDAVEAAQFVPVEALGIGSGGVRFTFVGRIK